MPSDSVLVGPFAGLSTVGLITAWIAVILIFVPEILATDVGWLATFSVVVTAPATMIWLTRGWLRR